MFTAPRDGTWFFALEEDFSGVSMICLKEDGWYSLSELVDGPEASLESYAAWTDAPEVPEHLMWLNRAKS